MFNHVTEAASSSGVATATNIRQSGGKIQVTLRNASGTGTVTVTALPGTKSDAYEAVENGTIDVSAPVSLIIEGNINAVKATSDNSGDSFIMEVRG